MAEPLLEVRDLRVHFDTPDGIVKAVDGISFTLERRETVGVVGESGSGKSVTFLTIMGLITRRMAKIEGRVLFRGEDLLTKSPEDMRRIRGAEMAMVFQDPFSSLHPFYKVGDQLVEAVLTHKEIDKKQAAGQAVELLGAVGIPRPGERFHDYPHQYSGGMRQRAMIAMALVHNPDLLIADEPTTALDVTVQAQILGLIDRLKDEFSVGVALITHDLGVVGDVAQRVLVMYAGRGAEMGSRDDIFSSPMHPYTWGLLESMPRLDRKDARLIPIEGSPPSLIFVPPGCPFHPRCPHRFEPCDKAIPELVDRGGGHPDACHLPVERKVRTWREREASRTKATA